jgi:excisionase family DNA binding protein
LDKDYKKLRELAIDYAPSFYRAALSLAENLLEVKRKMEEFRRRYGESAICRFDDKTGEFKVSYVGEGRRIWVKEPLRISPHLLKELDVASSDIPNVNDVLHVSISYIESEEKLEFLRPKEAAKMLGVSYKTLWRWWKEGKVKAIQLPSGRLRYYKNELEKIVHKNKTHTIDSDRDL